MKKTLAVICLVVVFAGSSLATTGNSSHGYGVKYKSLAGAGAALALSGLAAANNPGAMVFVGHRYDIDVSLLVADRSYTVDGQPSGTQGNFGLAPGTWESSDKYFVLPAVAGNWMLRDDRISVGVSAWSDGGVFGTNWPTDTYHGTFPTGVALTQLFVATTVAVKAADAHGLGLTPIFVYQRFEARGLETFGPMSSAPDKLTNNGRDNSYGCGYRAGYLGRLHEKLSLGASYQSRIWLGEFDEYSGFLAERGGFDIPPTWVVGIGLFPTPNVKVAADIQQILYEDVKSIANPLLPNLRTAQLGDEDGAGFGWKNILVYKAGLEYAGPNPWTWRLGYAYNDQPIPESEVMFNILSPGVSQHHFTMGFSTVLSGNNELSFALMYSHPNSVTGPNTLEVPGQQSLGIKMKQYEITLGYSFF
jgi:long-chain fatty acid transport protein